MELDLIYTDASRRRLGVLRGALLDLAFGSGENDFELTVPDRYPVMQGSVVAAIGTEYGGIVDGVRSVTGSDTVTYKGRTWHGVLAGRVLEPDPGKAYLTVSGEANGVLGMLLSRVGLTGLMAASPAHSGISVGTYQFDRYTDAYTGIRKMLRRSGARLGIEWDGDRAILSAVKVETVALDTDRNPVDVELDGRPVNHLVCLGKGELEERTVVHFYADTSGIISKQKTLTGVDEVAEVYDYSSADDEELESKGRERLQAMQDASKAELTDLDALGDRAGVGDVFTAFDPRTGVTVTTPVTKKIVRVKPSGVEVEYVTGEGSGSLRSHGESSIGSGGAVYTAGEGITIGGGVISADVTQDELDDAAARAEDAYAAATSITSIPVSYIEAL